MKLKLNYLNQPPYFRLVDDVLPVLLGVLFHLPEYLVQAMAHLVVVLVDDSQHLEVVLPPHKKFYVFVLQLHERLENLA